MPERKRRLTDPWLIKRNGTVEDRETGEVCGVVSRRGVQWVETYWPTRSRDRREAARALHERWKETR